MKTIDITTYRVNRLLKEQGWSQVELAQKLGVTQQTIQKWVRGKTSPSMENIDKLVDVTGHPSHWFMLPPDDQTDVPALSDEMKKPENIELLKVFDAFPDEDKRKILADLKEKKQTMEELVARWAEAQKGKRA